MKTAKSSNPTASMGTRGGARMRGGINRKTRVGRVDGCSAVAEAERREKQRIEQLAKNYTQRVAVNERGARIGEAHPGAVLTDHECDLMVELREEGCSLGWLAAKFEVSKSCVWKIVTGRRRAQTTARIKRIKACPC